MNRDHWIPAEVPNGLEVRQVYGFIFNSVGQILLLEDKGEYSLPGGKPEMGRIRQTTNCQRNRIGFKSRNFLGWDTP